MWLEKPRYDAAERGFYEALFDGHPPGKVRLQERASQAEVIRAGPQRPEGPHRCGKQAPAAAGRRGGPLCPPYWYFLHKDAEAPWLSKPHLRQRGVPLTMRLRPCDGPGA